MNLPNKEEQSSAEVGEGRAQAKENIGPSNTSPTQSGERVSQGRGGVRQAAKGRKQERFTALLHHVTIKLLRDSYYALKRQAAPGVDGVRWKEYEAGLDGRLAELIGKDNKRLVEIWNSLTGVKPVKKFTSREVATRRIFSEVQKLAVPQIGGSARSERAKAGAKRNRVPKGVANAQKTASAVPRAAIKKEVLLGLIARTRGASLEELMAALGWQKHSVRGFIATLGKTINIESCRNEQGVRTYRTSAAA